MREDSDPVEGSVVAKGELADGPEVVGRSDGEAGAVRSPHWKRWTAAAGVAALAAGAVVVAALVASRKSSANTCSWDDAELSPEAYERFAIYLREGKARDVAKDVRSGELTDAEADTWSESVKESFERSRHRGDIEPWEWRDFEEGWRPEGW